MPRLTKTTDPEQAAGAASARPRRGYPLGNRGLLRWAAGILVVLGVGHLLLTALATWSDVVGWADRGGWAAVPLTMAGWEAGPTAASLQNKLAFWAGPASFAVPLILLGALIWHLAGHGTRVPAAIGWALAAWCTVAGILLVPSPFFAGTVAGLLIVLAARGPAGSGRQDRV